MIRYLILIAAMFSGIRSYAQENINMIKILNIEQDVISLENRITDLINKNPTIANIQGLRQFHIFWLGSGTDKKEDFFNHSFLHKIFLGDHYDIRSSFLFWKKQEYIKATTLITDSTGNIVARGDAKLVTLFYEGSYLELPEMKMAKMFFDKKIDFVFLLGYPFSMRYKIGVKDNNLYALEDTKEGLKKYSWEEFMECCFDEWVYPRVARKNPH